MAQQVIIHRNQSGVIIINYPGYNGDVDGYNNKYKKIADFLDEKEIGAVVRTSNHIQTGVDYPQSARSFLRQTVDYALQNSQAICGLDQPRLYFVGVSAGAGAVAAVAHEYPQVEKTLLIAPAANVGVDIIQTGLSRYSGELYIVVGEKDEVVGMEAGQFFSTMAVKARVNKLVIVPNCDHQFRGAINGRILSKAYLWALVGDNTFPSPDGGIKLYD